MKAVINTRYGSPDVLQLKEMEKPIPNDHEVLVRVRATTVNRTDVANLKAKPFIMRFSNGLLRPKMPIGGTEFAGDIVELGKKVPSFNIGDRVYGFDDGGISSYAEYMVISADKAIATLPENLTYPQAAACIEGGHYAYNFINKVHLKKGDHVLVNGASGGIGTATVQLLKPLEVNITAVCNTKNIELLSSLGASRTIDYTKEDFTKDHLQYDCVFDSVGKSSFGRCKHLLKPGGVYISSELGWMIQNLFFSLISAIFGSMPGQAGKKVKFPYPPDILRSLRFIKKLQEAGKYQSVIDRVYPLENIAEAFRYVEKGQKTGNVVIMVKE